VLFLFIPATFRKQMFYVSFMTFGELGIMLISYTGVAITVLSTLSLSMIVAFILAAYSSWQLHAYRRQIFEESVKRTELEEKLKSNSDNLARLVDVRTKELVDAQARLVKSERLAAIGELAGMVAHDLRNPLAA
jgi:C4-dicarboxylate-specific signal transduction histidine kinase